jgi:hypothetical protein
MYHVIMNNPIKTRKVFSCMAITAIIKNKKNIILFTFVVTIFDWNKFVSLTNKWKILYFIHYIVSSNITRGMILNSWNWSRTFLQLNFTHNIIDNNHTTSYIIADNKTLLKSIFTFILFYKNCFGHFVHRKLTIVPSKFQFFLTIKKGFYCKYAIRWFTLYMYFSKNM